MNTKQQLYNQCQAFVNNRLQTIKSKIQELQESLTSETKSSAGDKHETGRAMVQLEREKTGHQLAEIQKTNQLLAKINLDKESKIVGLGSLVYTTKANYFIAISAGELIVENETFYAISVNTPIAKLLVSKTIGDKINFRSNIFTIENIT